MKTIILSSILIFSTTVFSNELDNFLSKMKKTQTYYQDKNNSISKKDEIMSDMNISSINSIKKEHHQFLKKLNNTTNENALSKIPWITQNMLNGMNKKKIETLTKNILNPIKEKQVDTIFYLFSKSQNNYDFYNFIKDISLLKSVKYYGVVQGMLSKKDLDELYIPFKFDKTLSDKAIIKMQPFIYRDLKLKRVPAYLFSKCSSSSENFKYSECKNKYLVRGDISLHQALEIVSKKDNYYLQYLNIIEKGEE